MNLFDGKQKRVVHEVILTQETDVILDGVYNGQYVVNFKVEQRLLKGRQEVDQVLVL